MLCGGHAMKELIVVRMIRIRAQVGFFLMLLMIQVGIRARRLVFDELVNDMRCVLLFGLKYN